MAVYQIGDVVKDINGKSVRIQAIWPGPSGLTASCVDVVPHMWRGEAHFSGSSWTLAQLDDFGHAATTSDAERYSDEQADTYASAQ